MGNESKVFAMAMLCFLAVAAASNALYRVKHRALAGEDKGDGKPNESGKVISFPPPISPPIQNAAPAVRGHTIPTQPQPNQSLPNSNNSDSSSFKSSPSVDSSTKTVPPPGPENLNRGPSKQGEDNTSLNPPRKEEHKASEAPKNEGDKPVLSPRKEDHLAPQGPEKRGGIASKAPTKGNVPKGSQEMLEPGSDKSEHESCETAIASNFTCQKGVLVACLLQSGNESTEFSLLVQNTGADDLNVNLKSPSNIKIDSKSFNLPKHSNKKVNLTADASRGLRIILNTGEGKDCVLQTKTSAFDWFQQFPAYAAQVRPMHGAYFLFATIIIIGGTWACCKFGKAEKRVDAGIPYQQLEMAATRTQTAPAVANEVPADSWDQGWDDDWDDEEAVVRAASKQSTENAPSNGLSSRSVNHSKDGWEIDWDD